MRIDTLTAQPALRYMLADAGFEPPLVSVRDGWGIFRVFMGQAAESAKDVGGFQASWIRENPEAPVFQVMFLRQLTDQAGGYGDLTRAIALQFLFEDAPKDLQERHVWSSEFLRLEDFFANVERLREFRFALEAAPSFADVILEAEE